MIRLIAFDFDGTLVDTKKLLLDIIEENIGKMGMRLTREFIEHFGDNPLRRSLDTMILDKKFLPLLVERIHIIFIGHAEKVKGAKDLQKLREVPARKVVISNSIEEFIKPVLSNLNASDIFSEIHGANAIIDKTSELKSVMRKDGLKPDEVIYVGDRPVDVKIAKNLGVHSVVVSNKASWSPRRDVAKEKPEFIIKSLAELKKVVLELNKKSKF